MGKPKPEYLARRGNRKPTLLATHLLQFKVGDGLEGRKARYGWYLGRLSLYITARVGGQDGTAWEGGGGKREEGTGGWLLSEWGQAGSHRARMRNTWRDANSTRKIAFNFFGIDSHKEPFQHS